MLQRGVCDAQRHGLAAVPQEIRVPLRMPLGDRVLVDYDDGSPIAVVPE